MVPPASPYFANRAGSGGGASGAKLGEGKDDVEEDADDDDEKEEEHGVPDDEEQGEETGIYAEAPPPAGNHLAGLFQLRCGNVTIPSVGGQYGRGGHGRSLSSAAPFLRRVFRRPSRNQTEGAAAAAAAAAAVEGEILAAEPLVPLHWHLLPLPHLRQLGQPFLSLLSLVEDEDDPNSNRATAADDSSSSSSSSSSSRLRVAMLVRYSDSNGLEMVSPALGDGDFDDESNDAGDGGDDSGDGSSDDTSSRASDLRAALAHCSVEFVRPSAQVVWPVGALVDGCGRALEDPAPLSADDAAAVETAASRTTNGAGATAAATATTKLLARYPWLREEARVYVHVPPLVGSDGASAAGRHRHGGGTRKGSGSGNGNGDGGGGGGSGPDGGRGGNGRGNGNAGQSEEDGRGGLRRRWHGLYPSSSRAFRDRLLPDLPDYCGLDDGELTEKQVEALAAYHEVSFIEQRSHEIPIPGLGGILKVLMKVTMPSIMDPWLDRLAEHTDHTISDQVQHKLVSELPKLTVKLVIPPTAFNVTSLCTDSVTASLTKSLVTSLSMELGPRIALPVQDALNSQLYEATAPFITRSVPDKVAKIVPYLLQRSLPMYITSRVTKALTHALIPTLTHALSHTPEQDIWCHYCYYYHHYCNYCHDSSESQYYTIYYSDCE